MIMPQLRKYILRGCGIFIFVILVSAKDGTALFEASVLSVRSQAAYGSVALCFFQLFLLFLFLFLLCLSKLFIDFQSAYH